MKFALRKFTKCPVRCSTPHTCLVFCQINSQTCEGESQDDQTPKALLYYFDLIKIVSTHDDMNTDGSSSMTYNVTKPYVVSKSNSMHDNNDSTVGLCVVRRPLNPGPSPSESVCLYK